MSTAGASSASSLRRGWRVLGEHRAFCILLGLAFVVRAATWWAYFPALTLINDAYGYIQLSRDVDFAQWVVLAPDRPFGYPMLLALAGDDGLNAGVVTLAQHLAGLASGALVYASLVRLGVRRWLALSAAFVALFDLRAVALEQTIMPEAFVTTGLLFAAYAAADRRARPWVLPLAAVILGFVALLRTSVLFAIPIWGLYLTWVSWRAWGRLVVTGAAVAVPIVVYAIAYGAAADTGPRLSNATGWFLYGRVALIADCEDFDPTVQERPLCQAPGTRTDDPGFYIWDQNSPGRKLFPSWGETFEAQRASDELVGGFARKAILSHPVLYARLVARDFVRFFTPGANPWVSEESILMPISLVPDTGPLGKAVWPEHEHQARWPAPVLGKAWEVLRTPRWLLGPLLILTAIGVAIGLWARVRRRPSPMAHDREALLFSGMAVSILLLTSATAQFGLRYLVCVAPLLLVGGAFVVDDVITALRRRRGAAP